MREDLFKAIREFTAQYAEAAEPYRREKLADQTADTQHDVQAATENEGPSCGFRAPEKDPQQ
jgi:hypothetical protein